jgi:transposase-like protein
MKRTRHTPEQVINKLREADAMLSSGRSMAQVLQHLGVSEQTFHRWRNQYGGMSSAEARALKERKAENARCRLLVAQRALCIRL